MSKAVAAVVKGDAGFLVPACLGTRDVRHISQIVISGRNERWDFLIISSRCFDDKNDVFSAVVVVSGPFYVYKSTPVMLAVVWHASLTHITPDSVTSTRCPLSFPA